MSGYKVSDGNVYKLRFGENSEFHGAEARLEGFTVGVYRAVVTDDQRFDAFVKALLDWNLEDDGGEPIPADRVGLDGLPAPLALTMVLQWWRKVTSPEPRNRATTTALPEENGAAAPLEMEAL